MTFFIAADDFHHADWTPPNLILTENQEHMKKISTLFTAILTLPTLTWAHPGHGGHGGNDGYTIIHYFTTMPHALLMWSAVIGITLYFRHLYTKEKQEAAAQKQQAAAQTQQAVARTQQAAARTQHPATQKQSDHARTIDRNRHH